MILGDALPKNLKGDNFRFDDPEIEILGLKARSEGFSLLLQDNNGAWRQTAYENIVYYPYKIRELFAQDIADGNGDRMAMLVLPRIGGIMLFHIGMMPPEDQLRKRLYEEESLVGIREVGLSSPLMQKGKTIEIRISEELSQGQMYTATVDGVKL